MKRIIPCLALAAFFSSLISVPAQMGGGGPSGPDFSGAMARLFSDNPAFTADIEMQAKNEKSGQDISMPGKLAYLEGKSRFEMNMTDIKGGNIPAGVAEQMKKMGMDSLVTLSLPDQKSLCLIYPNLKAYAEMQVKNLSDTKNAADFDVKVTELGKETVGTHDCVKNKVAVTDKEGKQHEYTVWNATDLKKFPVKIETTERDMDVVLVFNHVKFDKPATGQFEPPTGYKKYDSIMTLMQQEMMHRMSGPAGAAPQH